LPARVQRAIVSGKMPSYVMTGIQLSGGRTLDELMLGQVLLHDKLYRHSKVRAAEAMVASIFRELAELSSAPPALLPYNILDHHLFDLTAAGVERFVGRPVAEEDETHVAVACDLSKRLRERDLFVRAFAFALHMPLDPFHADIEQADGLEEIVRNSDEFEFRGELIGRIAAETLKVAKLGQPTVVDRYGEHLKPYIWLDPPVLPRDTTDSLHAYLIAEHRDRREVLEFKEGIVGASRWSEAYLLTRDTGYIFAPRDLAVVVHVASEVVFRRDHGIRMPRSMRAFVKLEAELVDALRRSLEQQGYYESLPKDLRPPARRLLAGDVPGRLRAVREALQGYDGPGESRAEKGLPLLTAERIVAWLQQFGEPFDDEPLRLLEQLRLIDRAHITGALRTFFHSNDAFVGAFVCPLGTARDSAAIAAYYAEDLRGETGAEVRALGEALAEDRPIVFVDDFIGSGQQSVSIVEAWMGVEPTTDLHEDRGAPLSAEFQQALLSRKLGFVFASGMPVGAKLLDNALSRLSLNAVVFLNESPPAPRAFQGALTSREQALRDFCERAGRQLLDDGIERHDAEWRSKRALGYGNNAFLVASGYNTPTQTLTCIWKKGTVDGFDWLPLLPRRAKL